MDGYPMSCLMDLCFMQQQTRNMFHQSYSNPDLGNESTLTPPISLDERPGADGWDSDDSDVTKVKLESNTPSYTRAARAVEAFLQLWPPAAPTPVSRSHSAHAIQSRDCQPLLLNPRPHSSGNLNPRASGRYTVTGPAQQITEQFLCKQSSLPWQNGSAAAEDLDRTTEQRRSAFVRVPARSRRNDKPSSSGNATRGPTSGPAQRNKGNPLTTFEAGPGKQGLPRVMITAPVAAGEDSGKTGAVKSAPTVRKPFVTPSEDANISEDSEHQQQLQAYVAWTNSQLKRLSSGSYRVVDDLRHDLQDGVTLVQLVEVLSGEQLEGVCRTPHALTQMKQNVEKVLEFMSNNQIRMHHTTAKDIVEGNLKSIMRLILALAVHYKPSSVKLSAQKQMQRAGAKQSTGTTQGLQNAAVAIAEAKREAVTSNIHKLHKPVEYQQHVVSNRPQDREHRFSYFKPPPITTAVVNNTRFEESSDHASSCNSPLGSISVSPTSSIRVSSPTSSEDIQTTSKSSSSQPKQQRADNSPDVDESESIEIYNQLLSQHNDIEIDISDTKQTLISLQQLLLHDQPPDGAEEAPIFEGSSAEEQIVIFKSKLQLTEQQLHECHNELSKVRSECMQLQGTKTGLQQRLTEQENAFLQMKAEFLHKEITHQNIDSEKSEFQKRLNEKDNQLKDLRKESTHKDRTIKQLKEELEHQREERDASVQALRTHIQTLSEKLQKVGETEAALSARVASQDRKMARLEGKMKQETQSNYQGTSPNNNCIQDFTAGRTEQIEVLQDSIRQLRYNLPHDERNQVALDTLEHTLSNILTRYSHIQSTQSKQNNSGDALYSSSSVLDGRSSSAAASVMSSMMFDYDRLDNGNNTLDHNSTKILYFSDHTVTPFMCTIPKRLGLVTLKDFKQIYDRQGNFRYHFKSLDPEFGTVKEEISNDDDILPGWEGKIVAWIEEDHG
ncbi:dixin-like [Tubulanus polymorphus]|uniref:dixin-like n=1 Tax=Tubulanus polymorphus TaxID=672921 RepID=UPI003DA1FFED